jgi:hypothetical protein
MSKKEGLTIDWETADKITLASLKDMLKILEKDNKVLGKKMKSAKLAEYEKQDYVNNQEYIVAVKIVVKYYGG